MKIYLDINLSKQQNNQLIEVVKDKNIFSSLSVQVNRLIDLSHVLNDVFIVKTFLHPVNICIISIALIAKYC